MKRKLTLGTFILVLLLTACQKSTLRDGAENSKSSQNENVEAQRAPASTVAHMQEAEMLKSIRQATSRYHSTTLAINAGYMQDNHCVSSPAGGMGYHWVNPTLVDPVFDPLKPEVMLYARGPGGNLRLVAVEYIVINVGQARPMLGSQLFTVGGTPVQAPHWSLHVWLHEENPSGIYVPFNPNITCP